jgi:hypothetical protein
MPSFRLRLGQEILARTAKTPRTGLSIKSASRSGANKDVASRANRPELLIADNIP